MDCNSNTMPICQFVSSGITSSHSRGFLVSVVLKNVLKPVKIGQKFQQLKTPSRLSLYGIVGFYGFYVKFNQG